MKLPLGVRGQAGPEGLGQTWAFTLREVRGPCRAGTKEGQLGHCEGPHCWGRAGDHPGLMVRAGPGQGPHTADEELDSGYPLE